MPTIERETIEVVTSALTFIIGVGSVFYILRQNVLTKALVGSARRTNEQLELSRQGMNETIELNNRELILAGQQTQSLSRPLIALSFENPEADGGRKIFLVVRNIGFGLARNIKLTFIPELQSCSPHFDLDHLHALIDSIPTLPPGERIGHAFDHVMEIRKSESAPPERYDVVVEYSGENGLTYSSSQILSARPYTKKQSNWFFIEKI